MTEAILLAACLVLAVVVVGLSVALSRLRSLTAYDVAALRAELGLRIEALEGSRHGLAGARPARPANEGEARPARRPDEAAWPASWESDYVITRIGDDAEVEAAVVVERPDARLFADLVLRETVVKAASVAYGVRRGLSPEHRNKMWFEMRREVRRARKQRRADLKEAQRAWKARERAGLPDESADDVGDDAA
jgi:hypothetical protein